MRRQRATFILRPETEFNVFPQGRVERCSLYLVADSSPIARDRETIEPYLQCHVLAGVDLTEWLRSDYFECGRGKGTSSNAG